MNETIINGIDVSECPCKDGDKCLEVPILNEYGDLLDYQDCEPQTLCPYRSKIKIQRLQEENEELKKENKNYTKLMLEQQEISQKYWECIEKIKQAIEVLAETCNVYPLKTNLDKLITTINEVFNDN